MNKITIHNYEAYLLDYSEGTLTVEDLASLKSFILAHPELEIQLEEEILPSLLEENEAVDFKNSLKKDTIFLEDEALINYLEGNLNPDEQKTVELKLAKDKELAHTFELYKKTLLPVDLNEKFEGSENLKKRDEDFVLTNLLIAFLENQLSPEEHSAVEKELSLDASIKAELELYKKTVLLADKTQIYPDKSELKKKGRVIALFGYRSVASIAAAVALLLALFVVYKAVSPDVTRVSPMAHKDEDHSGSKTVPNATGSFSSETDIQKTPLKINPQATATKKQLNRGATPKYSKDSISIDPVLNAREKHNLAENETIEKKQEDQNKELKQDATNSGLASNRDTANINTSDTELSKHTYLLALEEVEEEDATKKSSLKEGLWKRAVQLAKQANKMGVKSVDGQENSENNFRLSFNSFSVEKK